MRDQPEKARAKRLARLLRNPALDGTVLTPLLVRLALGDRPAGWIPIVAGPDGRRPGRPPGAPGRLRLL